MLQAKQLFNFIICVICDFIFDDLYDNSSGYKFNLQEYIII